MRVPCFWHQAAILPKILPLREKKRGKLFKMGIQGPKLILKIPPAKAFAK
jgi:hypothetical protein